MLLCIGRFVRHGHYITHSATNVGVLVKSDKHEATGIAARTNLATAAGNKEGRLAIERLDSVVNHESGNSVDLLAAIVDDGKITNRIPAGDIITAALELIVDTSVFLLKLLHDLLDLGALGEDIRVTCLTREELLKEYCNLRELQ